MPFFLWDSVTIGFHFLITFLGSPWASSFIVAAFFLLYYKVLHEN